MSNGPMCKGAKVSDLGRRLHGNDHARDDRHIVNQRLHDDAPHAAHLQGAQARW